MERRVIDNDKWKHSSLLDKYFVQVQPCNPDSSIGHFSPPPSERNKGEMR